METIVVVQFIMGLTKQLSSLTNLESALEGVDDLAVTSLTNWQASKAFATVTGKKAMCPPKEFLPLVHNALSLILAGKLTKLVLASMMEDVCMITQPSDDVLKSPRSAAHSFVWKERREATPSIVKRLLEEALHMTDSAKRTKTMKDFPFYDDIGRTPVYNAPFEHEQDVEKARWDTQVLECLRLLTTLQLASDDEQRIFLRYPVEMLYHTIA